LNIQWYPGHMAKSRRLLGDKLKIIDLVLEVVDARAPFSTKNPDFDNMFKQKQRILMLNKKDLADERITKLWLEYYRNEGLAVMDFCAIRDNPKMLVKRINDVLSPAIEKYRAKGMNKTLRCVAVGIPNVGKSALLNRIAGGKKLKEGNKPGVTRGLQWLKLNNNIELLDSPGLLWPKIENQANALNIALLKSINEDILNTEELALGVVDLFLKNYPQRLVQRYKLDAVQGKTNDEILTQICQKRGFLMKGGVLDFERASNMIIDEFQAGKLGRISLEKPS
jgi:ribosome biogenesis GTPase A